MTRPACQATAATLLVAALLIVGCRATSNRGDRDSSTLLENFRPAAGRVYSGGAPTASAAFEALMKLEIHTIVSVDGARPDTESARTRGMRYVHIPIGYDGINEHARLSLTRLMKECEGPIYIHCHHGRHRAPAAAALACQTVGLMDRSEATAFMRQAGTSAHYVGLWRDVEDFRLPADTSDLPKLVEIAEVDHITAIMAGIDRAWDRLKTSRASGWQPPASHPDILPAHESLLLEEGLRESARHAGSDAAPSLRTKLETAEAIARELRSALLRQDAAIADRHFHRLRESCRNCHSQHRNGAE